MKDLYYLLVPFSIAVVGFILHYGWKYLVWRKEIREDKKKKKRLNDLLGVDLQDWYNREYSN